MQILELLDRDLTALNENCTVSEAIEVLYNHGVSGLPIVDGECHVIGFISEKDIVMAALPGYLHMLRDPSFLPDFGQFRKHLRKIRNEPISKFMRSDVITFNEDDSDFYVANVIIRKNIKMAPVLKDGVLVGIVTRAHLVRHILHDHDE